MTTKKLRLTKIALKSIQDILLQKEKTSIIELDDKTIEADQADEENGKTKSWTSFKKFHLLNNDKRLLTNGKWLNDSHMCMAMIMIKNQFPQFNGMMSTHLQMSKPLPNALQILHVDNCHWCLFSTVDCIPGELRIYDSSYTHLSFGTTKTIAKLMHSDKQVITVHIMNVGKQRGSQDCGLYTIAFMTSLAYEKIPVTEVYEQEEMRPHLVSCFEKQSMSCFPVVKKRRVKNPIVKTTQIELYCTCRMPYDADQEMVGSDSCNGWYHLSCITAEARKRIGPFNKWFCERETCSISLKHAD